MKAYPAPQIMRAIALGCLTIESVIPGRAEGANPESITTNGAILDRQGLWIPALASLGRNDKGLERRLFDN